MNKSRKCRSCHTLKKINLFRNSKNGKEGKSSTCRECATHDFRRYKEENPWIKSYYKIRVRCEYKKDRCYEYYGGRGIKALLTKDEIRKIWFRDKAYKMITPTIDRLNPDGHYEFSNCRFLEHALNSGLRRPDGSVLRKRKFQRLKGEK